MWCLWWGGWGHSLVASLSAGGREALSCPEPRYRAALLPCSVSSALGLPRGPADFGESLPAGIHEHHRVPGGHGTRLARLG